MTINTSAIHRPRHRPASDPMLCFHPAADTAGLCNPVALAQSRRKRAWVEGLILLAFFLLALYVLIDNHVLTLFVHWSAHHEHHAVDSIVVGSLLGSVFLLAFTVRRAADLRATVRDMEAVSLHQELTLCRLKDAIEVIDAGFALWDAEDRVILSNSRYKCMFSEIDDLILQGAAFETILDRHYRQLQLKYPGVDLTEGRAERLRAHRECGTAVVRMPDGTWLQCDDRRTSEGGRVSLRTNITLMKQREEDLVALARDAEYQAVDLARMAEDLGQALQREKQATLEAESANTAKSRFLATMSHELRTPLNAIIGFAEIIKDHVLGNAMSDRYFDYAADIHSSGTHLLNIINTILDLSKVEAGSLNLDRTMVDLPQMINRCCKLVSSAAEAKEISITVRDLQATPFVYADAQSLRQILLNVFSNAIKFTPMNGRVGIAAEPSDGGWVVIRISDTGPGIPESEIPRLFEPFERMEDDHAGEASGTGLGLPIVRRLMELHGGTADLESTLAVGTTVVLRFPGPRADPAAAGPVIADPQKTV